MQQQEYFGVDSIKNLEHILEKEGSRNIFLVTGKTSFESCGAREAFDRYSGRCSFTRFSDFSSNPQLDEIKKGFEMFREKDYDAIIAVGGGSTIDVAKAIKLFNSQESNNSVPLVAIPTTAGSGSEATYFIVYYEGKEKQSKGDSELTLPNYAICDPQFTMSLPKTVAASTGIDALGQAIESYWCINSTTDSRRLSEQAIRLLIGNLEQAVNSPCIDNKEKVMKAANLAGKAINITKTTACHSIAYPITSYFQIPHGHAVGLTLGEMLIYNARVGSEDCLDKRGPEYVKTTIDELSEMLGGLNPEQARDKINSLMNAIGLKTRLSALGLTLEDSELILEKGFNPDRVKNNPRRLDKENLKTMLERII